MTAPRLPSSASLLAPLLALAAALAGCGSSAPMEGPRLERLKADIAAAKPGAVRLSAIGPKQLEVGGPGAQVILHADVRMPAVEGEAPPTGPEADARVIDFAQYDGYFKLMFVVVDELRSLGLAATADRSLWQARNYAVADGIQTQTEAAISTLLASLNAQEEIQQLYLLTPVQKRDLCISLATLRAARTGVPAQVAATTPTARQIAERYFDGPETPAPRFFLEAQALEFESRAERTLTADRRVGRARLRFRLLDALVPGARQVVLLESEHECVATAEPSGVSLDKKGRPVLSFKGTDPLEVAMRGALRAFLAEALPKLRGS